MSDASVIYPTRPSTDTTIRFLKREFVIEALDGLIFQAQGAIRFLERENDREARAAMQRLFDFARAAAGEMKAIEAVTPTSEVLPTRDQDADTRKAMP